MGREAICTVTSAGRTSEGRALLETDGIVFRGTFRLTIPFARVERVEAKDGSLRVRADGAWTTFALGSEAERWAERIRSPRSVVDKLGVRPGQRVLVLGRLDAALLAVLEASGASVATRLRGAPVDLVFLAAPDAAALDRLSALRRRIVPAGGIWVVWPKGGPGIKEDHIRDAALAAGLVDVKVVRLSGTRAALKLVIPRASR